MKKSLSIFFICIFSFLCVGCGEKDLSVITCSYSEKEDKTALSVTMEFERNNKKKQIISGKFVMDYSFEGLDKIDEQLKEELDDEEKESSEINSDTYIKQMFSNVCDDLNDIYESCYVRYTDDGAEITNNFSLGNLQKSSNGNFKVTMSLDELKEYVLEQNQFDGMICTIK